ncbi:hypothetical protein T492DRAFT_903506 [Pavlovales sp. CCMP2436]|nr:hypothetical protein T492DRAFT_903506 [Pavlovales sp. CCMP2436]
MSSDELMAASGAPLRPAERALARKREACDRERADEHEYSDRLRDVEKHEDRLERRHEREQERVAERQRVLDEPNALDKLGAKTREDLRARRYDEKRTDDAGKADRERRDSEWAAEASRLT